MLIVVIFYLIGLSGAEIPPEERYRLAHAGSLVGGGPKSNFSCSAKLLDLAKKKNEEKASRERWQ